MSRKTRNVLIAINLVSGVLNLCVGNWIVSTSNFAWAGLLSVR